jgi:phospholipid transport system substrate-binding protein
MLGQRCRRFIAPMLMGAFVLASNSAGAVDSEQARALVQAAANDTMTTFAGKKMGPDEARMALRPILAKYADMATESSQILGRYWNRASPEQQQEFSQLLERFVVTSFGAMLDEVPAGMRVEVRNAEIINGKLVVHSVAASSGEPPTPVDWVVVDTAAGRPVIVDVAIDGAAMVTTLNADFTSVIRSASGGLEGLFGPLRRKVTNLLASEASH